MTAVLVGEVYVMFTPGLEGETHLLRQRLLVMVTMLCNQHKTSRGRGREIEGTHPGNGECPLNVPAPSHVLTLAQVYSTSCSWAWTRPRR